MLIGIPVWSPALEPQMVRAFTNGLFQILHHFVSRPDPEHSFAKHN
jgi:hypothetical protein